jgi:hypothetical protein
MEASGGGANTTRAGGIAATQPAEALELAGDDGCGGVATKMVRGSSEYTVSAGTNSVFERTILETAPIERLANRVNQFLVLRGHKHGSLGVEASSASAKGGTTANPPRYLGSSLNALPSICSRAQQGTRLAMATRVCTNTGRIQSFLDNGGAIRFNCSLTTGNKPDPRALALGFPLQADVTAA